MRHFREEEGGNKTQRKNAGDMRNPTKGILDIMRIFCCCCCILLSFFISKPEVGFLLLHFRLWLIDIVSVRDVIINYAS